MNLSPFLLFEGNRAEAMRFYQSCRGGELKVTLPRDTPMKDQAPAHLHDKVGERLDRYCAMPHMDGVEATARLTAAGIAPPPRVPVPTTFDLDEYVFGALRAGAAGFLLKDAPASNCLRRSASSTVATRCSPPPSRAA